MHTSHSSLSFNYEKVSLEKCTGYANYDQLRLPPMRIYLRICISRVCAHTQQGTYEYRHRRCWVFAQRITKQDDFFLHFHSNCRCQKLRFLHTFLKLVVVEVFYHDLALCVGTVQYCVYLTIWKLYITFSIILHRKYRFSAYTTQYIMCTWHHI